MSKDAVLDIDVRTPEGAEYLEDHATSGVIGEFASYCRIPHGSGNEAAIVKWFYDRFEAAGWRPHFLEGDNLYCDIPASPGYEDVPVMVLQGHTDMVCAVSEGSGYRPESDCIRTVIDTDELSGKTVLRSDGRSSLGADCGIGVAAAVSVMKDDDFSHGPVRLLLTSREEVGLLGAKDVPACALEGAGALVNADGFGFGQIIAGSAGGRRVSYDRKCETEVSGGNGKHAIRIEMKGFTGGHSGYDIVRRRGNPVKLMAQLLVDIRDMGGVFGISEFTGGLKHNSIPSEAHAVIVTDSTGLEAAYEAAEDFRKVLEEFFSTTDPYAVITIGEVEIPERVLTAETENAVMDFLAGLLNGVYAYMDELPDVVDTSSNLGTVRCSAASDDVIDVHIFERSMTAEYRDAIVERHLAAAEKNGFEMTECSEYRPWIFDRNNRLLAIAEKAYRDVTGENAQAGASHVGLEPSVLGALNSGMEMISIGMQIHDAHSVNERVDLDTVGKFHAFLKNIIRSYAEQCKGAVKDIL